MDNRPIGFFDSGLGGLTCIESILEQLPEERIIYFGDTARTPYGSKSPQTIEKFSFQICDWLISQNVKMIVIACNTITATCLESLQKRYPGIPVVGIIVPIVNKIAREENDGVEIGVIGTKVTIASDAYGKKIRAKNDKVKIFSKACPLFVNLIEEGVYDHEIMDMTIKLYLDDFIRENKIKKLVLGCTHYPIIAKNIRRLYPDIEILNPSEEVIHRVKQILENEDMLSEKLEEEHVCYASDLSDVFKNMIDKIFEGKDEVKVKVHFKAFEDNLISQSK